MFDDKGNPELTSAPTEVAVSTAVERFRTCRWRAHIDNHAGDYCTHRDVQPFAGTTGFSPDSWCPDCEFYKVRRTPKKREAGDYY